MMAFRTQPTGCDTIKPHTWLRYQNAPAADTFDRVELLGIDKGRPMPQGIATSCTSHNAAGAVSSFFLFSQKGLLSRPLWSHYSMHFLLKFEQK
jgi:hypothetical protein